jgi:hypothetical protein
MPPRFPHWFPQDCPPASASDASGLVYRIVSGETLRDEDFLSHHELGTARGAPPCRRCGISVFDSFRNALHRLRLSPRLGTAISEGELTAEAGKTELTSAASGHMEWWAYADVIRRGYFGEPEPCT